MNAENCVVANIKGSNFFVCEEHVMNHYRNNDLLLEDNGFIIGYGKRKVPAITDDQKKELLEERKKMYESVRQYAKLPKKTRYRYLGRKCAVCSAAIPSHWKTCNLKACALAVARARRLLRKIK